MKNTLMMPANFTEIEETELENISGGVSSWWLRDLIRAIAGMFGAVDVGGSVSNSTVDSSTISSGAGGVGASASHTKGNSQKIDWTFDGNQFFSSFANLINLFIH